MKKYILFLLLIIILVSGCSKKVENTSTEKEKKEDIVEEVEVPKYSDLNNTPISLYKLNGNKLTKLNSIRIDPSPMEDIGIYQIYPSNEEEVYLNKGFGEQFYDEWMNYNKDNNLKIGFNLKYTLLDGTNISQNILNPSMTNDKYWENLLIYLYDDYANRGKGFYSHLEMEDYNDNTLFTAIKIQGCGNVLGIQNKIELEVFTYDTDDDFDENGEYRGNSFNKMNLCMNKDTCE